MTASVSSACTVSFCVRALVEQPAHPLVQIGPRDDLIAAGHFHQLQSAGPLVVLLQRGERRLHVFLRLAVEQLAHRLRRERIGRGEDQRLDNRLQLRGHASRQRLLPVPPTCRVPAFACPSVHPRWASGSPIGCGASAGRGRL